MSIYGVLGFHCGFRLFHDATYEISAHVTVHGVGPLSCDQIIECFTWQELSIPKTTMITVGTVFEITCPLSVNDVWIHFAAHAAFFDSAPAYHIQNFIFGHCYVADITVVIAMRFHTGVPPALESSVTATAIHSVPESPLEQNATSP
jgi:hypothetical protein